MKCRIAEWTGWGANILIVKGALKAIDRTKDKGLVVIYSYKGYQQSN